MGVTRLVPSGDFHTTRNKCSHEGGLIVVDYTVHYIAMKQPHIETALALIGQFKYISFAYDHHNSC